MLLFISHITFSKKETKQTYSSCYFFFPQMPSPRKKKSCKLVHAKEEVRKKCFCFLKKQFTIRITYGYSINCKKTSLLIHSVI